MKKLLLIVLITLLSTAPVQAGWRHHVYIIGGQIGLYHPGGDFWIWQCWMNPGGHSACSFKR